MTEHIITRGPWMDNTTVKWSLVSGQPDGRPDKTDLPGRAIKPGIQFYLPGPDGKLLVADLTDAEAADLYTQLEAHMENIAKPATKAEELIQVGEVVGWSDDLRREAHSYAKMAPSGSRWWPNTQDTRSGRWYSAKAWDKLQAFIDDLPGKAEPKAGDAPHRGYPALSGSGVITHSEVIAWTQKEREWAKDHVEPIEGGYRDKPSGRLYTSAGLRELNK